LFVTVIVYVMVPPEVAGSGASLLVIARSALRTTWVVTSFDVLSVSSGSSVVESAVALFLSRAPSAVEAGTSAVILMLRMAPATRVVKVVDPVHVADGTQSPGGV
jgi:hypothetical protein